MIIVSNTEQAIRFTCYEEMVDFFGESEYNSILNGDHSEFSISYV